MGTVTNIFRVNFSVGEVIHHRLFHYRGVIVDVDKDFQGSVQWYAVVAKSRPPKRVVWRARRSSGLGEREFFDNRRCQTRKIAASRAMPQSPDART